MMVRHWLHRCLAVTIAFAGIVAPTPATLATAATWDDAHVWTHWSGEQYTLVQEGDYFWVGTGGGVLHWRISTQTQTRYSVIDGLPSHRVFAIAIDPAGNRWFGGDGGLSRLDAEGIWTHFTTANSGLHANMIDGIAVGADGTLWLSHGLPDGDVSKRTPDGGWTWSPNRAVAVTADYAAVVQTQNENPLWAVTDGEVWVDFAVYAGSDWVDRTPAEAAGAGLHHMVARGDELWALLSNEAIFQWTGAAWQKLPPIEIEHEFYAEFHPTTLTIAPDARLWLGGEVTLIYPKGRAVIAAILPYDAPEDRHTLDTPLPPTAMLATDAGVAAVGSGWIHPPTGEDYTVSDMPFGTMVEDVITGGDGFQWLSSTIQDNLHSSVPFATQGIADQGTTVLHDDQWESVLPRMAFHVAAHTPGGDVWLNLEQQMIYDDWCTFRVTMRRHQGRWVTYELPITGPMSTHCPSITDIFAQDDRHTWFAYLGPVQFDGSSESGVLHLDDGGTPLDPADDRWTTYPFPNLRQAGMAAIAGDTIWLATYDALYRWAGNGWSQIISESGVRFCDLTAAGDEFLLARIVFPDQLCDAINGSARLTKIEPDGVSPQFTGSVDQFLRAHWDIAQQVNQRNSLFALTSNGAIWHLASGELCHRTEAEGDASCTPLPAPFATITPVEVDSRGHVWLAGDGALWRWSALPSFALQANPAWLWMTPASTKQSTLHLRSVEGFQGAAALSTGALPNGFAATLTPATINTGETATIIITATVGAALDEHALTVQAVGTGVNVPITRTARITVRVATEVYEQHLPVIAQP